MGACLHPPGAAPGDTAIPGHDGVDAALRLSWILALLSGGTWAMLALLCDGYTTPEAVFYITMLCGITAGSVTYGIAHREIPIAFVTPPLLTVVACLVFRAPTVDRLWLAAAVLLYLAALVRSAIHSERNFRETSRLKHEAIALAASLQDANRRVEDALASLPTGRPRTMRSPAC